MQRVGMTIGDGKNAGAFQGEWQVERVGGGLGRASRQPGQLFRSLPSAIVLHLAYIYQMVFADCGRLTCNMVMAANGEAQ